MTDKDLETPLANSGLGVKAKLAPDSGTFLRFRKFGDLALANTHVRMIYAEGTGRGALGLQHPATVSIFKPMRAEQ